MVSTSVPNFQGGSTASGNSAGAESTSSPAFGNRYSLTREIPDSFSLAGKARPSGLNLGVLFGAVGTALTVGVTTILGVKAHRAGGVSKAFTGEFWRKMNVKDFFTFKWGKFFEKTESPKAPTGDEAAQKLKDEQAAAQAVKAQEAAQKLKDEQAAAQAVKAQEAARPVGAGRKRVKPVTASATVSSNRTTVPIQDLTRKAGTPGAKRHTATIENRDSQAGAVASSTNGLEPRRPQQKTPISTGKAGKKKITKAAPAVRTSHSASEAASVQKPSGEASAETSTIERKKRSTLRRAAHWDNKRTKETAHALGNAIPDMPVIIPVDSGGGGSGVLEAMANAIPDIPDLPDLSFVGEIGGTVFSLIGAALGG